MAVNVLWDFDGTICDTYPAMAGALHAAAADLGVDLDDGDVYRLVRTTFSDAVAAVAGAAGVSEQEVVTEYTYRYLVIPVSAQPPFPGVVRVLKCVVDMGGTNGIVTHRGLASVNEFLAQFELADLFAVLVTADDGLPRKPEPDMFRVALEQLHGRNGSVIVIGARGLDIEGAAAAGLSAWAFGFDHPMAEFSFDDYEEAERRLSAEQV